MPSYYFEGDLVLAPLSIQSNQPVFEADTVSLKTQRTSYGNQRWELQFNLQSLSYVDRMVSQVTTFAVGNTMVMPQVPQASDRLTVTDSSISIGSGAASGSTSITLSQSNQNGRRIPKGYFVKFSNHDKVYMVTSDCNLGSGNTTLNIYPALVSSVGSSHTVLTGDAATLSYLQDISSVVGISFQDGVVSGQSINIKEKL